MEPPSTPVLIYDGECRFCCHFVEQWKGRTGDRVRYETRESARAWVLDEFYRRSAGAVLLMMPNGQFYEGAEAVFKVRALGGLGLGLWFFKNLPLARPLAQAVYGQVANHRPFFSWLTLKFPAYFGSAGDWVATRRIFLRGLAVVYAVAFLSLALQVRGLFGQEGISPVRPGLDAIWNHLGWEGCWRLPTLCWLNASDSFLLFLTWGGMGLSLLLLVGVAPGWIAFLLWLFFLSLVNVGGAFLSFQWDVLLLETGFLAIFLAPWTWRRGADNSPPSMVMVWLLRLLTARFIFTCGLVKLASDDPVWANLTALEYHYFTQPLPTWVAWYANQFPAWLQKLSAGGMFGIELALPFLVFCGRRGRVIALTGFLFLQLGIMLTGNHAYFNWLTVVLCLCLLDDRVLTWLKIPLKTVSGKKGISLTKSVTIGGVAVLLLTLTLWGGAHRWFGFYAPPVPLGAINERLHLVNGYGVFASMTTRRPELIVEGSEDGLNWKAYEFKYKPGDLMRYPVFVAPFQPRLDWQMWFVGLDSLRGDVPGWFASFLRQLLEGDKEVLLLLAEDPFEGRKPRLVRVQLYDYEFTSYAERKESGAWWKRKYLGPLVPAIGLGRFRQ